MREPIYYIEDLKNEITTLSVEIHHLRVQNEILRHSRDRARIAYCQAMADIVKPYRSPEDIAADRNWDCFDKETTNV